MIRIVRLGMPRAPGEGTRLGTVRRPPRGVPKAEFGKRDFYDVWLPELAPSAEVVSWALSEPWTPARWRAFERRYLAEMRKPLSGFDALPPIPPGVPPGRGGRRGDRR